MLVVDRVRADVRARSCGFLWRSKTLCVCVCVYVCEGRLPMFVCAFEVCLRERAITNVQHV